MGPGMMYYKTLLAQHGPTYAAVDCGSEESHAIRLRKLAEIIPRWSHTILDVGCGLGHLIDYGFFIDIHGYRGIDILPEMIAAARKRRPKYKFEVGDIYQSQIGWSSDYVLASGLFQFGDEDSVWSALQTMYRLARLGVACNFLRAGTPEECIMSPSAIMRMALALTPYFSIRANYLPNDFTLYLYREQQ